MIFCLFIYLKWLTVMTTFMLFNHKVMHNCNTMDSSMARFLVLHYLLEFDQIHVHWVSDTIWLSHQIDINSTFIIPSHFYKPISSTENKIGVKLNPHQKQSIVIENYLIIYVLIIVIPISLSKFYIIHKPN